jgi:hypothetical protein
MKTNRLALITTFVGLLFFSVGLFVGCIIYKQPTVRLHFERDRSSGFVTVYTFYTDKSGREVRDGPCYEFDASGRSFTKTQYRNGVAVESKMDFH